MKYRSGTIPVTVSTGGSMGSFQLQLIFPEKSWIRHDPINESKSEESDLITFRIIFLTGEWVGWDLRG